MANPKISVLIPTYNRKQYATDCIDSALNQTFQEDYEIIVRDDCSTDGVFEFIKEHYDQQISEGKIRIYSNSKNVGETNNIVRLIHDSLGKYIYILHCDDMLLPHALKHLYEVAEAANSEVVHQSYSLRFKSNGVIDDIENCKVFICDSNPSDKIRVLPNDAISRFQEWITDGVFMDAQYNLFLKEFVVNNEDFYEMGFPLPYSLYWTMTSKNLVKTPIICYVCRDNPYNASNKKITPEMIAKSIIMRIKLLEHMDKIFQKIDFFKNNEYFQYMAKAHIISITERWGIDRHKIYDNGITPEIYDAIADAFKKHFGRDYFYPMYWFNFARVAPFNRRVDIINFENTTPPPLQHK